VSVLVHGVDPEFSYAPFPRLAQTAKSVSLLPSCWHHSSGKPARRRPTFTVGRAAGYAGPANRVAAEVVTKYIITDMYAKAVQGSVASFGRFLNFTPNGNRSHALLAPHR